MKYKKYVAGTHTRARTFGAEVHRSNIRVERWHNKYENSELYCNDLLTKSNHTEIQTEERTFGTPGIYINKTHTHTHSGAENSLSQFCLTITKPFSPFYLKKNANY